MYNLVKIFCGCLVTSIGVIILKHSQVVTGGTAGLSLMLSYFFNMPFSTVFFSVNIPFYVFSVAKMGWKFTLSTLTAVTFLSLMTSVDRWLPLFSIHTVIGAILGGLIIGFGLSFIFINGSSLGGSNMLALYLQKRYRINPGITNFIFDFLVVSLSVYSVGLYKGMLSVLSITITSSVISYFKGRISPVSKSNSVTLFRNKESQGYSV